MRKALLFSIDNKSAENRSTIDWDSKLSGAAVCYGRLRQKAVNRMHFRATEGNIQHDEEQVYWIGGDQNARLFLHPCAPDRFLL